MVSLSLSLSLSLYLSLSLSLSISLSLLSQEFKQLYDKCIIRDTPLGPDAVPAAYTVD